MLLMLALPLQSFAAASTLGCQMAQQDAIEQMAMADGTMAGCHELDHPQTPHAQPNCKHCAACALASALPIPATDTPAFVPVPHHFTPQPAAPFSAFIPDGPERPPQPALA
jgi:hypothetical protein